MTKIIGITGTLGAGKGAIVEYLIEKHGFRHFSVRGYLKQQLQAAGIAEPTREDYLALGNSLRANNGGAFIIEQLLDLAEQSGRNAVIESVRTPDEVSLLNIRGKYLLSVDANAKLRYERIVPRASETDKISFETFLRHERIESEGTDGSTPNLIVCKQLTQPQFRLRNDGSLEALYEQVEQALALMR